MILNAKIMKNKILFILSLLSVMPIHAMATDASPAALSVAVYDFKGDGDTAQIGRNVTTLITANLNHRSTPETVRKALFDGKSWRSAFVDEDGETAISVKL